MSQYRKRLFDIIFETDTKTGKIFNISMLIVIIFSIVLVMLESVPSINQKHGDLLRLMEWGVTIIMTLEVILRTYATPKAHTYLFSFYGIIDIISILPTFLSLILIGTHSLLVIRAIRLLRVFRMLKLTRYSSAGRNLAGAIWSSRGKISIFLIFVVTLVIIIGTVMYLVEGEENGFTSIPLSIYWAIVTLTTVGYGDISPATPFGQFIASVVMIIGYSIIAVPTGIVTAEIIKKDKNTQVCPHCLYDQHDDDATFCKKCGSQLN